MKDRKVSMGQLRFARSLLRFELIMNQRGFAARAGMPKWAVPYASCGFFHSRCVNGHGCAQLLNTHHASFDQLTSARAAQLGHCQWGDAFESLILPNTYALLGLNYASRMAHGAWAARGQINPTAAPDVARRFFPLLLRRKVA